jgi:hypothetical protein
MNTLLSIVVVGVSANTEPLLRIILDADPLAQNSWRSDFYFFFPGRTQFYNRQKHDYGDFFFCANTLLLLRSRIDPRASEGNCWNGVLWSSGDGRWMFDLLRLPTMSLSARLLFEEEKRAKQR